MSFKTVVLFGRAGSGKSSAATMIANKIPGSVEVALAAPIKEFAEAIFHFDKGALYGPSEMRSRKQTVTPEYAARVRKSLWVLGRTFTSEWSLTMRSVFGSTLTLPQRQAAVGALIRWVEDTLARGEIDARSVCQQLGTEIGRVHWGPQVWIAVAIHRLRERHVASPFPVAVVTDGRFGNELANLRLVLAAKCVRIYRKSADAERASHASEVSFPDDQFMDWVIDNDGSIDDLRTAVTEALEIFGWIEG